MSTKKRIHLICNAHLDPVWSWEWQEGAAEAISTFRVAADFCEEYDGFVFNHNEVILYKWIEEYEPALFERIQRLVREKKWHIMGGWYLQPDCNMPSGESFVRQILLGRTYFNEKFGVRPTTAINFDPFGHTRGLPQILAKSGYDSYIHCRPNQTDYPMPYNTYYWVGYDGSKILVSRTKTYQTLKGKACERIEEQIKNENDKECIFVLWGIGNHGGGPSKIDMDCISEFMNEHDDIDIIHSTPEQYFADVKNMENIPEWQNDLNPFAVGCYTSQIRIKQKHRELENELYSFEKMVSSAYYQRLVDYPDKELREVMCDLATSQFHDIIPGSSIQPVENTSLRLIDHGLEIISRLKTRVFFALASGQPKAKESEIPILVYNPHPYPIKHIVECEFQLSDQNWEDTWTLPVAYSGETKLHSQLEKEDSNLNLDWRKKIVFEAELKPSMMNRFDCRLEILPEKPKPQPNELKDNIHFKTDDIEVIINIKTGLIDKYSVSGVDYLEKDSLLALVINDNEDPWAMAVKDFREVVGRFKLMSEEESAVFSGVRAKTLPAIRIIEDGTVRMVVEAVFIYEHSAICQKYKLPKSGTEIEVETRVHWNEKNKMLKLSIPVSVEEAKYIGQVAYGIGELPVNGDEAVAQKWVAVVSQDNNMAFTCINDGIYGSDYSEDGLRISLLRSPAYSAHPINDRPLIPQDRYSPHIDQGERVFRFWFNAGFFDERINNIDTQSLVKNEVPFALSFFPSGLGNIPNQFIVLSDKSVQMSAVKKGEYGNELIVRLFETTGKNRTISLELPFASIKSDIELSPFEIRTLKIDLETKKINFVNLVEESLD